MKPEQDHHLEARSVLGSAREFPLQKLQQPKIVGQVDNPMLETVRRLWWRGFDHVCGFLVLIRLSIFDRIYGTKPPSLADIQREADQLRLVRAFPAVSEPINPAKYHAGQNRDAI
jgi:hypothetical protein